eukprot:scaffold65444_cov59-Phaeocystis_antarctica.AAC.5
MWAVARLTGLPSWCMIPMPVAVPSAGDAAPAAAPAPAASPAALPAAPLAEAVNGVAMAWGAVGCASPFPPE